MHQFSLYDFERRNGEVYDMISHNADIQLNMGFATNVDVVK